MVRHLYLVCLLSGICAAQFGSQANPEEQLTVRVTYEDDHAVGANITVQLLSAYGTVADTRTTDGFGSVFFTHLTPAKYKLRITGEGIVTTETGELDMTASGPNLTEYVKVRKIAEPNGPGTISAAELNVPPDAKKEFDKGSASMKKEDWAEAKIHLSRAVSLYPKYATAYGNLGMTDAKMGDGAGAVEAFRKAAELDQNLTQANLYLGHFYYDNKDYKQAEPYLQRAVNADQKNPQLLTALANSQLQNGEADQALANAQKVHTLPDHKKFAIAHLIAAEVLTSRGDSTRVKQEYKLFLKEDPDSPMAGRVKDELAKSNSGAR